MSAHLTLVTEHGRRIVEVAAMEPRSPNSAHGREHRRGARLGRPRGSGRECVACIPASRVRDIPAANSSPAKGSGAASGTDAAVDPSSPAGSTVLRGDLGAVTAEYAIVILAGVAFAGLLVAILRSGEIRQMLVDLVQQALGSAG